MKWRETENAGDPQGAGAETKPTGDETAGPVEPTITQPIPPDKSGGAFRLAVVHSETLSLTFTGKPGLSDVPFRYAQMTVMIWHSGDSYDLMIGGVKVRARRWIAMFNLS